MSENVSDREEALRRIEQENSYYKVKELDQIRESLNLDLEAMLSKIKISCEKIRTSTDLTIQSNYKTNGCAWTGPDAIETNKQIKYYLDTVENAIKMISRNMRDIDYEYEKKRSELFKKML